MARPKVNLVVLDPGSGKARPGSWVTFYHSNTQDKAALFADDDLAPVANPVQANGLGQVAVRIAAGTYDVSMTWDGAQPTVVEDVLAWSPEVDVITSPGDIIIGGPAGENIRLAVGANGQVLLVENGMPAWRTLKGGVGLPPGSPGSLLSYGANNDLSSILPGLQDQALVMQGGIPSWASILAAGQLLPINQPGDLVVGSIPSGTPARLARGATDDVLTVSDTGALVWGAHTAISPGGGYCYLSFLSATALALLPWQGNQVWIAGRARTVPDAGVVLSNAGLAADTTYYIYAAWTGSAITLEASTTGHSDTGGLTHKSTDPTRTLVGMVRTDSNVSFRDDPGVRGVVSFFYPGLASATAFFSAPRSLAVPMATWQELHQEMRVVFMTWGWEQVVIALTGTARASAGGLVFSSTLVADGGVTPLTGTVMTTAVANEWTNISVTEVATFGEGYHWVSLYGATGGPAGQVVTWHGDPAGVHACRIHVLTQT